MSNFLIQVALQRVHDKTLAAAMVDAVGDHAAALLAGGRGGVLWRAAEACVRLNLKPQIQAKFVGAIGCAVEAGHSGQRHVPPTTGEGQKEHDTGGSVEVDVKTKPPPSSSDPFTAARAWVPALLGARLPGEGGLDRLFLNVPGTRILQNVLQFHTPVAAPVLKAVATLPEDLLAAVARDNLGSRCLLDPILGDTGTEQKGEKVKNKPAEGARRTILRAFKGHLLAMACNRVAWHVLIKLFKGVDMKEKR